MKCVGGALEWKRTGEGEVNLTFSLVYVKRGFS